MMNQLQGSMYLLKSLSQHVDLILLVSFLIDHVRCKPQIEATAQDIGVCETDGTTSFPPTLLQWQITKADGSVLNFPDSPKETSHLPLHIPLTEDLAGSIAKW